MRKATDIFTGKTIYVGEVLNESTGEWEPVEEKSEESKNDSEE